MTLLIKVKTRNIVFAKSRETLLIMYLLFFSSFSAFLSSGVEKAADAQYLDQFRLLKSCF